MTTENKRKKGRIERGWDCTTESGSKLCMFVSWVFCFCSQQFEEDALKSSEKQVNKKVTSCGFTLVIKYN